MSNCFWEIGMNFRTRALPSISISISISITF